MLLNNKSWKVVDEAAPYVPTTSNVPGPPTEEESERLMLTPCTSDFVVRTLCHGSWCREGTARGVSRRNVFFFSWIILSSMLKEKGAVQHTHTQQPSVCSAQAFLCDLRSQYLGLVPSWTFGVSNLLQFNHCWEHICESE